MLRLFVAITLPPEIRAMLDRLCVGLPGAKWVEPEAMHLTLRFIGEVDGALAEDVHEALSRIEAPAFALTLAGIGCFQQGGKVHTLWAGVEKQPLLRHLRDKIESAVVRAGVEPEKRSRFKAHVTLARFRNGAAGDIVTFLERTSRFSAPPFDVEEFVLMRSHPGSAGPHYEALAEYPLNRGAASATPLASRTPASAAES
jgi:2'-5' RNA ligase